MKWKRMTGKRSERWREDVKNGNVGMYGGEDEYRKLG